MYKFITLLCLTFAVQTVYTAVSRLPPVEKPAEFACEEGCYVPELNMVLEYNVPYSPPADEYGCKQYNCQEDGVTQIYTCGAIGVGPGCRKVDGDLSASYPDCCPTVECDKNSGPVSAVG